MTETIDRSQAVADDVSALLRARNPLLWVVTREEARVERYLAEAAAAAGYETVTWDVGQGVETIAGLPWPQGGNQDPSATMTAIRDQSQRDGRRLWIMRDLPVWLAGPTGAAPLRQLRNLARSLPGTPRNSAQAVVVLTPSGEVPPELADHATVIEWPNPDRNEIAEILDAAIENIADEEKRAAAAPNGTRAAAIDAAVGLTGEEAAACYARSLVQTGKIDPATVAREKKRVIAREKVLEWFDPLSGGLDAVGGLDDLKKWLTERSSAYSPRAREYGLPSPKGAVLVGVPGCGKSLTAKAIATAWGVPLLRMDLGALKSKFVGDSEANLRKALRVIESIGRCVVWLDEVEKALAGATDGSADGGVSADALGAILSWMQERQGEAFVVATANKVEGLPPEFLRKGRFDEVWFVDLPNERERQEIMAAALRSYGRDRAKIDLAAVAAKTDTFTGAEIAALVPDALYRAFSDGEREIKTADLVQAAAAVVPLAKTAEDKIEALRKWSKGRARPVTPTETAAPSSRRGRQLDI